jgi:coenzyme F420-reducing hydrogenase beta subunit
MRKIALLFIIVYSFSSCAELQQVANQLPGVMEQGSLDISGGLKEALNNGINEQVVKLTAVDGFFKNEAVKILLPDELKKVDKTLRDIGMSKLADDGLRVLNRAAEDAVKEATPIFVDAIRRMSFNDAKNILMGNENAATAYLQSSTTNALYVKFNPVIKNSFAKVGADKVWTNIITKYNSVPLVKKVNPDLTDYTTKKAMEGVFKMIAVEEKDIRTNLASRSSDLLRKVFALQDQK